MKPPAVDIERVRKGQYRANLGFKNKFLLRWGKTTDGGVEVLNERIYFYPDVYREINKKLLVQLGVYDSIVANPPSGVEFAWLYINPDKAGGAELNKAILASKLNDALELNVWQEYDMGVIYPNGVDAVFDSGTIAEITAHLKSDWADILAVQNTYVDASSNSDIEYILSKYALYGDVETLDTEIVDVNREITTKTKKLESGKVLKVLETSINFVLRVKRKVGISDTDTIIEHISSYSDRLDAAKLAAAQRAEISSGDDDNYISTYTPPVDNGYFYNNKLRASLFNASNLKTRKLINEVITKGLDSGFQRKKVSSWKKLVGVVVFIIAVIYAPYLAEGLGLLAAGASPLTVAAVSVSIGALAITVLSAAMTAWGDDEGAMAQQPFAKVVNKLSMVLGVAALIQNMVNNLANASTQAAQKAAEEGAKQALLDAGKEATKEAIKDIATESMKDYTRKITVDGIAEYAKTAFGSMTDVSLNNTLKGLNMVVKYTQKKEANKLQSEIAAKNRKLEELEKENMKEEGANRLLGLEHIKTYTQQLELDKGPYDVDGQYEGTRYNVCKRSFTALYSTLDKPKDRFSRY